MSESFQHKLSRVRPPRVQITYDVETGGAIEMKELPFVVGILADLTGVPYEQRTDYQGAEIKDQSVPHYPPVDGSAPPEKPITWRASTQPMADRKFVEIDRDNFQDVVAKIVPFLKLSGVANKIGEGDLGPVELCFTKLEDFEPDSIAQQYNKTRELLEKRRRLSDLKSKLDGNVKLLTYLNKIVQNEGGERAALKGEVGAGAAAAPAPAAAAPAAPATPPPAAPPPAAG